MTTEADPLAAYPGSEADRRLASCGSAEAYRAEVARVVHRAAAMGLIPARIKVGHHGSAVTDLSNPAEVCWYVDLLTRTDLGRRWAYVAPLQPELGAAIAALRDLYRTERKIAHGMRLLEELEERLPIVPAGALGGEPVEWPI